MRRYGLLAVLLVAGLVFCWGSLGGASGAGSPLVITPTNPLPGSVVNIRTPTISATFTDSQSAVDTQSVSITVDGADVTGVDTTSITTTGITYVVPTILRLANGNHTIVVTAADHSGNHAEYSWGFVVNTSAVSPTPVIAFHTQTWLIGIGLTAAVGAGGYGSYILYLKRTRRFTYRKYFATHPVKKQYVVLYVPAIAAFIFVLIGLIYVTTQPNLPWMAPELVAAGGLFIGLTAYAIDARRERTRTRAYERAFAQYLFEMADAMRGGIDPAKAIVELSKTHTNILKKHLRIAADAIRLGRPFDEVVRDMVAPMRSPLIGRYAGLIADASGVGGETSAVVYRAAKDMDDFLKIEVERGKQLVMPVAVLYIAFGVLMAVLFSLLNIAPSLGTVSISVFSGSNPLSTSGGDSSAASVASVPKLGVDVLRTRFLDLMLINSLGTGIIIGAFTEGKARYGLLHSLALIAATIIAFLIIYP